MLAVAGNTSSFARAWPAGDAQRHYSCSTQACLGIRPARRTWLPIQAISIDRRKHLEMAWQRQQQQENQATALQGRLQLRTVLEVKNLLELDNMSELIGSNILVVFFYSRSCGSCKPVMASFENLCHQAAVERAGVTFAKHDVRNEYDDVSDMSRFYSVKAVPAFVFFVDGAPVRRVTMRDIRRLTGTGSEMRAAMHADLLKLSEVLREVVFRNAPSARA